MLHTQCSLSQFKVININNSFFNYIYSEDILFLINPKLLVNITSPIPLINQNKLVRDDFSVPTSVFSKFDKKMRVNSCDQDTIKIKKQKVKSNKSKQKVSNKIDDVKLFVNTPDDLFNQDVLDRSNTKSRKKVTKSKKKSKLEIDFSNKQDILNESLLSDANMKILKRDTSISVVKPLSIQDLSLQIDVPGAEIITYLFLSKGIAATINDVIDISIICDIVKNYGFSLFNSPLNLDVNTYKPQYTNTSSITIKKDPIITILGHVDHGKTTLLDAILKTNLVNQESGGITQALSAHEISWTHEFEKQKLIFLDTPGHKSFRKMRLRGAKITDIALLVIAMDDGLKPQTIEAIEYIKDMSLSCIVVITKSDKLSNYLSKIKQDLANNGILCEEFGGSISLIEVNALSGKNIDTLLSEICVLSKSKNLTVSPQELAVGTIIESYIDKKQGPVVNLVVQNGTLKLGSIIASENLYGKVKSITNLSNVRVKSSGPSSIVQVLGFTNLPQAGCLFRVFDSEKNAKKYCMRHTDVKQFDIILKSLNTRIRSDVSSEAKQLKLILKADTQGTLEAILDLLYNIPQSKVQINVVFASFGSISNSDVELALTTSACILAFNVSISSQLSSLLKQYKIIYKSFNIIYSLLSYVEDSMLNLVEPVYDKVLIGKATVQTIFHMNKGVVAGCIVKEGKVKTQSYINVYRNNLIVYEGYISSLKIIKSNVEEVIAVNECGLMSDFKLWQNEDLIVAYDLVSRDKVL
uniref:Translation initiation factor IF-2, chloroplastic n=1 Tax=Periphykon beckeri TaxID=2006982 RepID=A0A1Z1M2V8_9FLOR|nr:translation initiation factor 2 [Periphykon beckeri]ARW60407.1 translation initiation factor 2 [Periphykon beckeri]